MSLLHQVALTFVNKIGPVLARSMASHFGGAEEVFKKSKEALTQARGVGAKRLELSDFNEALRRAEQELKFIENNKVDVLYYTDPRFPRNLKNCHDSPLLLYSKGNANLNNHRIISIVGTRNATDYGRNLCKQLIEELQDYNILIVSGLALGIDTAAHRESIALNVPTVGVLGHGYDRMYPTQNSSLAEKMQQNGGLLTEYPSGTKPNRENFPSRNRIVAGMADATIVVEAGLKGGALITAEIANSYNRDVFAFPGRLGDEYSEGCNFLIRNNKAALLTCVADLAYSLGWEKNSDITSPPEQLILPIDLSAEERAVYEIIQQNKLPLAIDDLSIKANMPMSQLAMTLLDMELQGFIRSLPGKMYKVN
ncbi:MULTISPECIES: DNA-processing protein DprA [unclassified Mucilaginibacter]|uniref:DNA-processing protein DprA n=1 Tax=unclassified Mucilaginibacter TaxID=2617802 RepID=UPI002AC982D0|nr:MULTISPECIES: DNA-processing protein DprA [unclassified Mucilaginibacter]MEB0261502.1 DNA-processing protein DprA [Mucilaginibacter sp. 10I4]MEB0277861.1 DNA-processing protein DprA [Mucilaginibacter sp. 10B2]MEB0300592.1 DNA-processing protein DprA [Mucilaginibacter sp. 5C4]WPX22753.1 DNA-processing protein DprA [Mucilaginibacter sp. 5C4]